MATQPFDYGLFGNGQSTPQSDYSENFRPVGDPMSAAMATLQYNATPAIRGDAFGQLTNMITSRRRMEAVKQARVNGLSPEMGDSYYSYIRDTLTDFGDMQGAEMVEQKRLQAVQLKTEQDYKKALTEGAGLDNIGKRQEINSNAPERKLRIAEAGVTQTDKQIAQRDKAIALDTRKQDWEEAHFDSPQSKFERDKELAKIKYGYDLDLENARITGAIKAAQIKRGLDLNKPLTTQEAKMGQANWISHVSRLKESDSAADQAKYKRLQESLPMAIEDILEKAGGTNDESLIARAELARQGANVAANYRELKSNFPDSDEAKLWDEATSVPSDARLIQSKGKYYWYVSPTEVYEAKVK